MDKDTTFTFRVSEKELALFKVAIDLTGEDISMAHALRQLMRWYASGCGERLRLPIPVIFPTGVDEHLHSRVT